MPVTCSRPQLLRHCLLSITSRCLCPILCDSLCTHFFGNGGGTPEHRYVECSPSKPEGSDEVNMFNNCHTTMTDIVQCF